ncbi:MAG TPA: 50S ribosomal protein L19 [Candidatus Paceibacterota bacterium]|jgi:large subunit ribosomal protein L19|nr:50S ribosomal protein L19 [Candidatus Paceibacterota bacterium]
MNPIALFHSKLESKDKFEGVRPGWTVRISQRIKDGEKTRVQAFEGTVIARKHGTTPSGTITIRKVTDGIGVEKVFPIHLPSIESVKVLKKTTARRAKLYYLRDKTAKEIRKKVKAERAQTKASAEAAETPVASQ